MELTTLKSQFEEHVKEVDIAITKAFRVLVREEERVDLAKDIKAQQDKIEQLRSSVEELRASKKSLVDDLRCKIAALDIDNSCRRITPQVASDKTKKLQGSASAPNLKLCTTTGRMFSLPGRSTPQPLALEAGGQDGCDKGDTAPLTTPGPHSQQQPGASSSLKAAAAVALG